jgi:hypothetical protein
MKHLLFLVGLFLFSCNSSSCKLATSEVLCTDSCKKTYQHLINDKTEIIGISDTQDMKGVLHCKCYSKTKNAI